MSYGNGMRSKSSPSEQRGASRREWLFRLILLGGSLLFSLALAEVVARAFFPIYGGVDNVDLDGRPVKEWFAPSSVSGSAEGP